MLLVDNLTEDMSRKDHARTEDFGVVIKSESVHGETVDKIDHPGIVLVQYGDGGLPRSLVRTLLLYSVIWGIKMSTTGGLSVRNIDATEHCLVQLGLLVN